MRTQQPFTKKQLVRGSTLAVGGQALKVITNIALLAGLSRLLSPRDFGLVAMAAVLVNFIAVIKDFGLTQPIIQAAELDDAQLATLFWLNLCVAMVLSVATCASGYVLAQFYDQPEMVSICSALALGTLMQGASSIHRALMQREMRIAKLQATDVASVIGGGIVSLILAYNELRYWSIIVGSVCSSALLLILSARAEKWRPGCVMDFKKARHLITSGGRMSLSNGFYFIQRNCDSFLIGGALGPAVLGVYNRAYQLMLSPLSLATSPIKSIALPYLAGLYNRDIVAWRDAIMNCSRLLSAALMPLIGACALWASEIAGVVLGPGWAEVVPTYYALLGAAFGYVIGIPTGWILLSSGSTARLLVHQAISAAVVLITFAIGVRYGLITAATSYGLISIALAIGQLVDAAQYCDLKAKSILRSIYSPAVIVLAGVCVAKGVTYQNWVMSNVCISSIKCVIFCGIVGGCLRKELADILLLARATTNKR